MSNSCDLSAFNELLNYEGTNIISDINNKLKYKTIKELEKLRDDLNNKQLQIQRISNSQKTVGKFNSFMRGFKKTITGKNSRCSNEGIIVSKLRERVSAELDGIDKLKEDGFESHELNDTLLNKIGTKYLFAAERKRRGELIIYTPPVEYTYESRTSNSFVHDEWREPRSYYFIDENGKKVSFKEYTEVLLKKIASSNESTFGGRRKISRKHQHLTLKKRKNSRKTRRNNRK